METINMTVVRAEAALFNTLSDATRAVMHEVIKANQPLAFYEGGYSAATWGMLLALGCDIADAGYKLAVAQVSWAYAAEIVKIVDAAGGVNTK